MTGATSTFTDIIAELKKTNTGLSSFSKDIVAGLELIAGAQEQMAQNIHTLGQAITIPQQEKQGRLESLKELVSFSASVSFQNVISNTLKSAALSKIGKSFPGVFQASSDGYKSLGKAVASLAGKKVQAGAENLQTLASALVTFGEIRWTRIVIGLAALKTMTTLFPALGNALGSPMMAKAMKGGEKFGLFLDKFGASLAGFGAKLGDVFAGIMSGIARGITYFGNGKVVKGLLTMGLLAVAIAANAGAFMLFSMVSWKDVFIGLGAIAAFTVAAMGLGLLMESGILELGIIALGALGLALVPFGLAMLMAGKGMQLFGEGLKGMGESLTQLVPPFVELSVMAPGLLATAGAIGILAAAIAAFAGASVIGGIANFFGKITGTSPIKQLAALAELGPGLTSTADALDRIRQNSSLQSDTPSATGEITSAQREKSELMHSASVTEAAAAANVNSGSSSQTGVTAMANSTVNSVIVNSSWMPDRSSVLVLAPAFA